MEAYREQSARAHPESTWSVGARPALPIGRRDARAFSVRGHVARRDRSPSVTSYVPDNGGCSQATAWMLRLIGSSLGPQAFPRFFLSSSKGDQRRATKDAVESPRRLSSNREKKISTSPSPCRSNRYTHTTIQRLRTCTRERSHVHPRMLCAFVTFYYWQSAPTDITARALLIGRRDANRPTPQIPIHPRKNCIE